MRLEQITPGRQQSLLFLQAALLLGLVHTSARR